MPPPYSMFQRDNIQKNGSSITIILGKEQLYGDPSYVLGFHKKHQDFNMSQKVQSKVQLDNISLQ